MLNIEIFHDNHFPLMVVIKFVRRNQSKEILSEENSSLIKITRQRLDEISSPFKRRFEE